MPTFKAKVRYKYTQIPVKQHMAFYATIPIEVPKQSDTAILKKLDEKYKGKYEIEILDVSWI